MAKFKLPEPLKAWKVLTRLDDVNGNAVYKVTKREIDGSVTAAILTGVSLEGGDYSDENVDYLLNEADFIQSIIDIGAVSNYIAVATEENERKKKFDLYIVTEDIPSLSDVLQTKQPEEEDIVDFGIQMSEALEKLEANKIFHGNIKPSNIYVTPDNRYKLGGFIDAESKVNDLTYVAPEIQRNEKADFTTDIYSTGLVMYSMANRGKLPFEDVDVTPRDAMIKRFDGETVTAPENGSEKLKSVIVIACQPENQNRWKNAGNLKNALLSIKSDIDEDKRAKENVIVPETTEFEGNVFEEENTENKEDNGDTAAVIGAAGIAAGVAAAGAATANAAEDAEQPSDIEKLEAELEIKTEPSASESSDIPVNDSADAPVDNTPVVPDDEIDNRVFDDYKLETKVFSINDPVKSGEKDYGDYFDEPETNETKPENDKNRLEDYKVFDDNKDLKEDKPKKKKGKKGLAVAIIIGIIVLLALIGAFLYFALTKGMFGGVNPFDNTQETTAAVEETTAASTQSTQPSTQQSTTAPATQEPTAGGVKSLIRVVGEPYETAKQMLEAEGFTVQEGSYYYDDFYYAGNVISQYPEAYTDVEPGSVITLNISLGPEKKESSDSSSSESDSSSDDDSPSYSSGAINSSYLSQDEVSDMSNSELNMALNEIYARRGRIFTDPDLNAYFRSQDWYTPKYTAEEFASNVVFNEYEERNINLLLNEQSDRGMR